MIFLDTHIVVWLYAGFLDKLCPYALDLIDQNPLRISPIVLLEMQYLYEIKRITVQGEAIYKDLHFRIGLITDQTDWSLVTKEALKMSWTRDPFDRYVTAHAKVCNISLLTADQTILKQFSLAVFDAKKSHRA